MVLDWMVMDAATGARLMPPDRPRDIKGTSAREPRTPPHLRIETVTNVNRVAPAGHSGTC